MTTELYYLTLTTLFTGLLWAPYILNRMAENGIWKALYNPSVELRPKAQWAERLMRAHSNAVENLVIFAPLVLVLHQLGISTALTAQACTFYFVLRVAHAVIYVARVPLLRSLTFVGGVACQLALAFTILGWV